ncbi:DUF4185 domain-containing protein, partial [Patescibacteria group bacterium]|nr:DUF4185 domain-containing protein [Patescibacteria group bacterium]
KASGSDNWPITWADDDNQYTAWGDGWGFRESGDKKSLGVSKVSGSSASSFTGTDLKTWDEGGADGGIGKSYGILSVAGTLYMWIGYGGDGSGPRAWQNSKVYSSTNHGSSWSGAGWSFTDDDMANPTFLQFGKDYADAIDNYVYIYAPDIAGFDLDIGDGYGDYPSLTQQGSGKIILMRVPKDKIMTESSYEFFAGLDASDNPSWVSNLSSRSPVITSSNGVGWTMSAIYYPDIDRYILMTEHTASHAGNLAVYDAPEPWGPWTVVEENTDWGNSSLGNSTAFFWNISPKWINSKDFTLVFTGSQSYDYWNTVDCTVTTGGSSSSSGGSGGSCCCCCGSGGGSSSGGSGSIKSITWDCDSLKYQAEESDGWTTTWSNDDNQYTAWGDGYGFSEDGDKESLGVSRIEGDSADSFTGADIWTGHGKGSIFSVSGTLYMWVCEGDEGDEDNWSGWECAKHSRLYKSTNYGEDWSKADWNITRTDNGILTPSFLQAGKDYGEAKDDYVYSYSIDDKYGDSYTLPNPGKVDLMRVLKDKIMTESSYEFFAGLDANDEPSWTADVSQKTPVLTNSTEGIGWTVSVIYYPPIDRYILITEHTISHGGNLIVYDAPNPWGPWTVVEKNTAWCGFDTVFGGSIVPKWIDGNDFTFVFSGPQTYDRWNTVTGTIELNSSSITAANFDANWVFAPVEFNSNLFLPVSDNQGNEANCCTYVKKYDGSSWPTDLTMGVGTEDIAKLIVYKSKLYAITESNDGIYYRDTSGTWIKTKDFAGKEEGEYGAFDAAILNNKLYTGVSGYYSSDNLNIFEHNGSTWTIIKTFQKSGERPTAWALGADGSNLYVGIAGFARGTSGDTSFDGIWKYDGSTSWTQESAVKAQSFENAFGTMFAGGQGTIYRRSSAGSWSEVYNTGASFVLSLKLIGDALYAGTENPPCVYKTSDGSSWDEVECFGSGDGPAYVGEYQGGLVVSYYEDGKAYIK